MESEQKQEIDKNIKFSKIINGLKSLKRPENNLDKFRLN